MRTLTIIFIIVASLGLAIGANLQGEAEWRAQYNELFVQERKPGSVTPLEPEVTLDRLKRLLDTMPRQDMEGHYEIKKLVEISDVNLDKCQSGNLPRLLIDALINAGFQVHICHYIEHYASKQRKLCYEPLKKEIVECRNKLGEQDQKDLELFRKSLSFDDSGFLRPISNLVTYEDVLAEISAMRRTSLNYLKSKLGDLKKKIKNKKNFDKEFDRTISSVCKRVLDAFAGPLEKMRIFNGQVPWSLFDQIETEILESVEMCKLQRKRRSDITEQAYNYFEAGIY